MSMQDRAIFDLYEDESVHLQIEIHNDQPFLHCTVYQWSSSKYIEFLTIWEDIKDRLRQEGVDYLFCWSPAPDTTRFAQMFGFSHILTDEAEHSLLFMRY